MTAHTASDHIIRRQQAIAAAIADIRAIEADDGVTRPALAKIRDRLVQLAGQSALFPTADFPLDPSGGNRMYRLSEDADHRFALYMSVGKTGKRTPPHDHTTWAVIAGLRGKEHNHFYRRIDDASIPGRGQVEVIGQETVAPGNGIFLMPDDIHAIEVEGTPPTLMFHMYGLAIDRLHDRIAYNMKNGTYKHFPASDGIVDMNEAEKG